MRRASATLALALGATMLGGACAAERAPTGSAPAAGWVETAKAANGAADDAMAEGDHERARGALEEALRAPEPGGVAEEDRRIVRQDLLFHIAQVELSAGEPEAALRRAEEGLALGRHDDLFTANLLVVLGRAHEALGREEQAADDYYDALEINDALLRRTLRPNEEIP